MSAAVRKGSTAGVTEPAPPTADKGNTIQNMIQFLSIFKNGLFELTILGGQNLYTKSGKKPRPFCAVFLIDSSGGATPADAQGAQGHLVDKTDVADSSPVNPTWGKTFAIEIPPGTKKIQIHVISFHRLGKNRLIGVCEIELASVTQNYWEVEPTLFDLVQDKAVKEKGKLQLKWSWTSAFARNDDFRLAFMNYKKITPILFANGFHVSLAICNALQSEDMVAVALIRIFNSQRLAAPLVLRLLQIDIDTNLRATAAGNTLFRRDSMATRMCSHYFKLIGFLYLHNTLSAGINTLLADTTRYEVDPHRIRSGEDIHVNSERLVAAVNEILSAIFASTGRIPLNMRLLLLQVKNYLEERGKPNLTPVVIVNLFFLRYLCPAIFLPEGCYLVEKPVEVTPEGRRVLTLMTKIIQTLATGVRQEDSTLEPFMHPLLPMLQPMRAATETFVTALLEPITSGPPDEFHSRLEEDDYPKLLSVVVNKMHGKWEKIEKELATVHEASGTAPDIKANVDGEFGVLKGILKTT
ncbi:RasGTPase-activating protein [Pelomyxa schiedti]|nr:RasGTPase-activating protein [Pelomyxa schiedti]